MKAAVWSCAAGLGLLACSLQPPVHDVSLALWPVQGLSQAAQQVGPKAQARLAGAVEPRDEAHLQQLLADPQGPPLLWLGPRTWRGDWQIRRSVRIVGAGPTTVLQGSGTGTVVDVEGRDVSIENLVITGTGERHTQEDSACKLRGSGHSLRHTELRHVLFGAVVAGCKGCTVEANHITGRAGDAELRGDGIKLWSADDGLVMGNRVEDVRDLVVWYSNRVQLRHNVVVRSRYGCHFMYTHDCDLRDSALVDNTVGIFVMYSADLRISGSVLAGARGPAGVGLGFKDSDDIQVIGNYLVRNTVGSYFDTTPRSPDHPVLLRDNVIAINDIALRWHSQPHGVALRGNDFVSNPEAVEVDGGGDATTADFEGNFWSDYAGYDLDGDGWGDVDHLQKHLSSSLTEEKPVLKFFRGTAALAVIDTLARAVPVLATKLLLRDARPAMQPQHRLSNLRG
ncbi:MAG: nitrous oxide reductase family maturation protein NosD [Deltaproteobacteria bacterium]|nr:nitrous oxide reductase family maturation protein NosD [Deltaproteobacteria bacterium]